MSLRKDSKIKIVLAIPSLRTGGAERVMSFLAANINEDKFDAHLLVIGSQNDVSYSIQGVATTFLEKKRVSSAIPAIILFLRKHRPHIAMSAIAHLNAAMAISSCFLPKIRLVGRETSIASIDSGKKSLFSYMPFFSKLVRRRINYIVCQSEDMKKDLHLNHGYPQEKLIIINNPISNKFQIKEGGRKNSTKQLITVGRLVKMKGHRRILSALKNLDILFHYTIIGNGPEKENLLKQIDSDGLANRITHIPFSKKIEEHLAESDVFLQGSFSEGFPNALLESCAVGTPVLAFPAPGGTSEIIEQGVNGFIAENVDDFITKLMSILGNNWSPEQVRNSVIQKYNEKKILLDYENLFESIKK